jgi:serine/threonine-protein kinase
MASLLERLKERKLVQWAIAYLAGAWVLFEVSDAVGGRLGWPDVLYRGLLVVLAVGFFVTLVLAWYHGEKGRQRVSGPELLMVATLFVIAAGAVSTLGREPGAMQVEEQPASGEVEDVAATLNQLPGIAVLPFANRSGVPDDQYFTDGIQDDLLTRLQRVPGLHVISRTSSDTYRDTDKRIPEIGRELRVGYVLEGSVQRAGDRVHINVQLIDAVSEGHLWGETYDRVLTTENLFDIQSEIVRIVAAELDIELREEERLRAARRTTNDLEAYELYLRGVELSSSRAAVKEKIPLFQEAIERDTGFVAAHAELAKAHALQYAMRDERSVETAAAARTAAQRAVELAPESEDAQLAMGLYLYRVEKDYEAALAWLIRASRTLLGDYDYHQYRGWVQRRAGQWRQAVASMEAAAALSPRSSQIWNDLGGTYRALRRYAEAEAAYREWARIRGPDYVAPLYELARVAWLRDGTTDGWQPYLEAITSMSPTAPGMASAGRLAWGVAMTEGRYEDALAILPNLDDIVGGQNSRNPKPLLEAETLEALGQQGAALERYRDAVSILESLIEEVPEDERYHAALAWAYAGLGMREEAIREGLRAVEIMPRERDALDGPHQLFKLAAVYARLGETDEALEVLEDLLNAPSGRFAPNVLEDHYRLRPIQEDPRFQELMDRERDRVF